MKTLTVKILIEETKAIIESMESNLANLADVGNESHVICIGELWMAFSIDATGRLFNPRPTRVEAATRLTQDQAEAIAQTVRNGNRERGQAFHVRDAMQKNLENLRGVLGALGRI